MKIISIILLILITTFVAFPCTDKHSDEHENYTEICQVECSESHSDLVHNEETCTPFCTCNCCHTQIAELDDQVNLIIQYIIIDREEQSFSTLDQFIQPKVTPPKS